MPVGWLRSRAGREIRASAREVPAYKKLTKEIEAAAGGMGLLQSKSWRSIGASAFL